jgi:hypothetical protein
MIILCSGEYQEVRDRNQQEAGTDFVTSSCIICTINKYYEGNEIE